MTLCQKEVLVQFQKHKLHFWGSKSGLQLTVLAKESRHNEKSKIMYRKEVLSIGLCVTPTYIALFTMAGRFCKNFQSLHACRAAKCTFLSLVILNGSRLLYIPLRMRTLLNLLFR